MANEKCYLILEGGTGEMCGRSAMHIRDSLALLKDGMETSLSIGYFTMDAGGEALGEMKLLKDADKELQFRNSSTNFEYLALAAKVRMLMENMDMGNAEMMKQASSSGTKMESNLGLLVPDWQKKGSVLTERELGLDLGNGFEGNMINGSILSSVALKAISGTNENKAVGFEGIANDIVKSSGRYQVRVIFVGSGIGGEGRTNLSLHPAVLKEMCIEAVRKDLNMEPEAAKEYVEKCLRIGVIMVGSAFCFPKTEKLSQNIAGSVAGTLRDYPRETSEAVDAFYLLENDNMYVQASQPSTGNKQYKHPHAIELVAYACMDDFFTRTEEDFLRLRNNPDDLYSKAPIIPYYSLPDNGKTTWKNLALPEEYRKALSARLRFDAMLIYWLRPQLDIDAEQQNQNELLGSEFILKMFGVNEGKKLQRMKVAYADLVKNIVEPFKILLAREHLFLAWLSDISRTGRDWEQMTDLPAEYLTDLFPLRELDKLTELSDSETSKPDGYTSELRGSMTGLVLDVLTNCEEGNLYQGTKLTPDQVRRRMNYRKGGKQNTFIELMEQLYDICADNGVSRWFKRR